MCTQTQNSIFTSKTASRERKRVIVLSSRKKLLRPSCQAGSGSTRRNVLRRSGNPATEVWPNAQPDLLLQPAWERRRGAFCDVKKGFSGSTILSAKLVSNQLGPCYSWRFHDIDVPIRVDIATLLIESLDLDGHFGALKSRRRCRSALRRPVLTRTLRGLLCAHITESTFPKSVTAVEARGPATRTRLRSQRGACRNMPMNRRARQADLGLRFARPGQVDGNTHVLKCHKALRSKVLFQRTLGVRISNSTPPVSKRRGSVAVKEHSRRARDEDVIVSPIDHST